MILSEITVVAFRVDSSFAIGTGHVMRCLTLADALQKSGAFCTFICRPHAGHLMDLIRQRGHSVLVLPVEAANFEIPAEPAHAAWLGTDWSTDAEQTRQVLGLQRVHWLVVDHYALDRSWEQAVRPACDKLMVIDDLADRPHDCDLLLDQNLGRVEDDYSGLLYSRTCKLIGPRFALLRPEFRHWRDYSLARRVHPQLKRLLITMGGVDQDNAAGKVLDELRTCDLPSDLSITIVMGPRAPWLTQVKAQAAAMPWATQVRAGVSNMAQLMADCDLAIGAAGGTAWERCALGLPTLMLVLAENQKAGAKALDEANAAVIVHEIGRVPSLLASVIGTGSEPIALKKMGHSAAALIDGAGASRVVQKVICNYV